MVEMSMTEMYGKVVETHVRGFGQRSSSQRYQWIASFEPPYCTNTSPTATCWNRLSSSDASRRPLAMQVGLFLSILACPWCLPWSISQALCLKLCASSSVPQASATRAITPSACVLIHHRRRPEGIAERSSPPDACPALTPLLELPSA